jgi:hypothetical protein
MVFTSEQIERLPFSTLEEIEADYERRVEEAQATHAAALKKLSRYSEEKAERIRENSDDRLIDAMEGAVRDRDIHLAMLEQKSRDTPVDTTG